MPTPGQAVPSRTRRTPARLATRILPRLDQREAAAFRRPLLGTGLWMFQTQRLTAERQYRSAAENVAVSLVIGVAAAALPG